jgi:glycosyltransferase involved in cell wall biosynthesis
MNKKHIVIDARIIDTTTGRYCRGLLEGLTETAGFDSIRCTVLVPSSSRDAWQEFYSDKFEFVACNVKNYSVSEQIRLKWILERLKPDLVHFCMPQQPVWYEASPVVTTFHDLTLLKTYNSDKNWLIFHLKQKVGKWVFLKSLEESKSIITPSNYTSDDIIQTFSELDGLSDKISTIYLSGELPKAPELTGKKKGKGDRYVFVRPKKYLLYVGNQADYKNIPRLMEAHQELLKKDPSLHLVLASPPGKATSTNERLAKNRGYKNIVFTGWLSNKDLLELYEKCSCYVFPSTMEGFGLPGLEAMGMGAPVAAARATSLPEIYGKAAVYFDPFNAQDMAETIRQVLSNQRLRDEMIARGKKQFTKYSWKKMAAETLEIYRKAV